MNKGSIKAQITKQLQKGIFDALVLSGVKEKQIFNFINNYNDDLEASIIIDFIKTLATPSADLLGLYQEQSPDYWIRIEALSVGDPLPEVKELKQRKLDLRKNWNRRPKFDDKRLRVRKD